MANRAQTSFIVVVSIGLVAAGSLYARTTGEVSKTCPLSGMEFKAKVEFSGTAFCRRFDLKQVGPIGGPGLVPVCPDHDLPIYREFKEDELKKLREWVETPEFKKLSKTESVYFRIARAEELLGSTDLKIGWVVNLASWEVEGDAERHRRYLTEAANRTLRGLRAEKLTPEERQSKLFLLADIRRRLGHFGAARRCLESIERSASESSSVIPQDVFERQRSYVAAQDTQHHYLTNERVDENRCRRADRAQQREQQGRTTH